MKTKKPKKAEQNLAKHINFIRFANRIGEKKRNGLQIAPGESEKKTAKERETEVDVCV